MRKAIILIAMLPLLTAGLMAQNADEIIAKYLKTIGGLEKIRAAKTLVRTGTFMGGGGFEAVVKQENKRPNQVREEFMIQGMSGITAYDGKAGWRISPWSGKKDADDLDEEGLRSIIEDADFDGPLIDYKEKGNIVTYLGTEPVEGTDALKLEVKLPTGDVHYYYMDTDYYVPIKVGIKRTIRGEDHEYELTLGDYKEVDGWYLPFSVETNVKGSQDRSKITYETMQTNIALSDDRFTKPDAVPVPAPKSGK